MTETDLRSKVLSVAQGWLGKNEADGSHREIIDLYNRNRLPGTYAMSYDDPWCAAFVSAVGMAAGLRDVILPHVNCDGMIASYKLAGRWIENDAYTPKAGDIIFYDWQDSGARDSTVHLSSTCDHVFNIVSVARAVNVCIVSVGCFVFNVSCGDCDTTFSFFGSFIDVFEIYSSTDLVSVMQCFCDSCSQSCFTMVNVTDSTDIHMGFGSYKFFLCHWNLLLINFN